MKYDYCRNCTALKAASYCGMSFVVGQCQQNCKHNRNYDGYVYDRGYNERLKSLRIEAMQDVYAKSSGE